MRYGVWVSVVLAGAGVLFGGELAWRLVGVAVVVGVVLMGVMLERLEGAVRAGAVVVRFLEDLCGVLERVVERGYRVSEAGAGAGGGVEGVVEGYKEELVERGLSEEEAERAAEEMRRLTELLRSLGVGG